MPLLKPEEVSAKLGVTKPALFGIRRRDESFPAPVRVSPRVLRWHEADIDNWLEKQKETKTNVKNK